MAKRGFQSKEAAQNGRARGHEKAREFARIIGLPNDYQNDPSAKKDVIDRAGDAHSLKSGKKKWQIFLYGKNRFLTDSGFKTFNGFGKLLANLIDSFPLNFSDYEANKIDAKVKLGKAQLELAGKLQSSPDYVEGFFHKSMFNAGEVSYLTVYGEYDDIYHVFHNKEVISLLKSNLIVENSKARTAKQMDHQKTIFKLNGKNFAELEVRTEEDHYREIRFNMMSQSALALFRTIDQNPKQAFGNRVLIYGTAKAKFR